MEYENVGDDYAEENCMEKAADDEYGVGAGGRRVKRRRKAVSDFFDEEAAVGSEEDEDEGDDFLDTEAEIPDEDERPNHRLRPLPAREDEQVDVEKIEKIIQERYSKRLDVECGEEATDVQQQALLPSVRDPKLWMVKCSVR